MFIRGFHLRLLVTVCIILRSMLHFTLLVLGLPLQQLGLLFSLKLRKKSIISLVGVDPPFRGGDDFAERSCK